MMLSDRDLRYRLTRTPRNPHWNIGISPAVEDSAIQPASIDLRLFNIIKVEWGAAQVWRKLVWEEVDINGYTDFGPADDPVDGYPLMPGQVILASTMEHITVPFDLAARVEGKSSVGRLFVTTHQTAGFVDPGFSGQITLEIKNESPVVVFLQAGTRICQINFTQLSSPALRPYGSEGLGSHYQGQTGPTEAETSA